MIRHISIKNFATIEKAEIDFHSGLNTITGETGAGKSVAVEAMSLPLAVVQTLHMSVPGKTRP